MEERNQYIASDRVKACTGEMRAEEERAKLQFTNSLLILKYFI